ncbi:MAG TPA: Hsp70 family protein, partial [Streptosporangiaceae bacterium]|nr:Hsp70 family protein [Streptosporangiaceae bacterium]
IEPIIADTLACCRELVRASGHEVADLAAILLVGGGTRMPSVTEALRAEFGRPLRYVEDPELAVALGAAYRTCQQPGQRTRLVESIAVPGGLTSLAVAPDGPGGTPTAVTGGLDGTLRIWRLDDGTPGPSLAAHDGIVSTLDISADGAVVVSGGQDGAVHVWNPGPGTARTICYHSGWVTTVRISADGGLVFSVGDDGYWRCSPLTGARAAGNGQRVRGDRAASRRARDGAADGQLRGARPAAGSMSTSRPGLCAIADSAGLIQLTNRRQVSAGPAAGTISAVALDAAGQRLAAGYAQGALRVWQLPKSKPFLEVSAEPDGVAPVRDLRFSPGGRLVSGHGDGSVRVWNLDQPTRPAVVGSHEGQVRSVAFPTDELAVSGGADGRIRVWPARVLEREPKPPSPLHSPVARQPGQEGVLP